MNKNTIIIGAGFAGLSAACYLAKAGNKVTVLEKNIQSGGRARQLHQEGFTFDIGPTFYWMPDVFESFFNDFDKSASDYYDLIKLNPAYEVFFGVGDTIKIADNINSITEVFESIEKGSGKKLTQFMAQAKDNYEIAIKDLVYKPGRNLLEIVTPQTATRLHLFIDTIEKQVNRAFEDKRLREILKFPVLFLGAKPSKTPAFYNFMNYADFHLGTWHPKGGMYKVVEAMVSLSESLGVKIINNCDVSEIKVENKQATKVITNQGDFDCDLVLSGADYAHTETLLPKENRQYTESYWNKKTFAPSALLFYVGFDKRLQNLSHHSLFFDTDFVKHSKSIYDTPEWPENPLFYASFPSMTDTNAAPAGKEAGIFLIPIAPGIEDNPETRAHYFELIMRRLEHLTDQDVLSSVLFKASYCIDDFVKDYNSFKGNAYGLANTLFQTHILRPKLQSKKVRNLFFTGQLTVPGPGVPPSLISGKIVSDLIEKLHS